MRQLTCHVTACAATLLLSANAVAQFAFVDGLTGLVVMHGSGYVGINLYSPTNKLIAANANENAGLGNTTFDGSLAPSGLFWLDFSGFPDPLYLGQILPPSWEFEAHDLCGEVVLSNFATVPLPIVAGPIEDRFVFTCEYPIPEPSTMLMAGMGALGLCSRRRRNG